MTGSRETRKGPTVLCGTDFCGEGLKCRKWKRNRKQTDLITANTDNIAKYGYNIISAIT